MHRKNIIIGTLLALAGSWCAAQTVYRCGNSYSAQPCEGAAVVAPPQQAPTAAEGARAVKAAQVDVRRAEVLEKARLAQEKNAPRAVILGGPATPPAAAASAKGKPAKAKDNEREKDFVAIVPGSAKPKDRKK